MSYADTKDFEIRAAMLRNRASARARAFGEALLMADAESAANSVVASSELLSDFSARFGGEDAGKQNHAH